MRRKTLIIFIILLPLTSTWCSSMKFDWVFNQLVGIGGKLRERFVATVCDSVKKAITNSFSPLAQSEMKSERMNFVGGNKKNVSELKTAVGRVVNDSVNDRMANRTTSSRNRRHVGILPPLVKTASLCTLKIIFDYTLTDDNERQDTKMKVYNCVQKVDSYFRRLDFNQDGKPDNIGFQIKRSAYVHRNEMPWGVNDKIFWNTPGEFFREMAFYDFRGFCGGVVVTKRDLDQEFKDTGLAVWSTTMVRLNPTNVTQGICSKNMPTFPGGVSADYGRHLVNYVPINILPDRTKPRWKNTRNFLCLQIMHQFGHLFGAQDDPRDSNGVCHPLFQENWYAMHYPVASGTNLTQAMRLSPCSLKDMRNFMKDFLIEKYGRPNCLLNCYKNDGCVTDFIDEEPDIETTTSRCWLVSISLTAWKASFSSLMFCVSVWSFVDYALVGL